MQDVVEGGAKGEWGWTKRKRERAKKLN